MLIYVCEFLILESVNFLVFNCEVYVIVVVVLLYVVDGGVWDKCVCFVVVKRMGILNCN